MKRFTRKKLARYLWERAGRPDGHEVGEANRHTYEQEAIQAVDAIEAMGFKIVDNRLSVLVKKER